MQYTPVFRRLGVVLLAATLFLSSCSRFPIDTGEKENASSSASDWIAYMLESQTDFLGCRIGGEDFSLRAVEREVTQSETEAADVYAITETDTETGLRFVTTLTAFRAHDALEIVSTITHTGQDKSPVLSELRAADIRLPIPGREGITLKTARGCLATGVDDDYDFGEIRQPMGVGGTYTYAPEGGRSCDGAWPYFDLVGSEGGAVVAVGWTGQWEAAFSPVPGGVRLQAGQQYFNSYLLPGESVTTPSVTVLFYRGFSEEGRNDFRQLVLDAYTPANVKDESFLFPVSFAFVTPFRKEEAIPRVKSFKEDGYDDLCAWLDAGWYGNNPLDWSSQVGNWYPNPETFGENGIRELSDTVHDMGYRFILWFEPERAQANSEAAKNRSLFYEHEGSGGLLLRLDTEEGYEWMWNLLSDAIENYGMDIYRQDFNLRPLEYWSEHDEPDRVGLSENRYINNLYRLMDALLEKHPHLVIDNCASGGRRLDIAMMKRCISLFRTDYSCLQTCDPQGVQYHTQSLLSWLPLHGSAIWGDQLNDFYTCVSTVSSGVVISSGNRLATDMTLALQPYYRGDYYSLLTPTYDNVSHQAWELYDPEKEEGFVVALARPKTEAGKLTLTLKGLDPDKTYSLTVYDSSVRLAKGSGKELMEEGFSVHLKPREAQLLMIRAVEGEGEAK
ncbi:MAG: alpha-galactosidase [Ruminococcaceae bacterium]|nr:alpha-galactosidase [Oscillospiraceae bacterium]